MADDTALVWFRHDLRVHDHPALQAAALGSAHVAGVFVLDPALLEGRPRSANRTAWMLTCLAELREALRALGSELLVRAGDPVTVLPELAARAGAARVHWTSDVYGCVIGRDYPAPLVDHAAERIEAVSRWEAAGAATVRVGV